MWNEMLISLQWEFCEWNAFCDMHNKCINHYVHKISADAVFLLMKCNPILHVCVCFSVQDTIFSWNTVFCVTQFRNSKVTLGTPYFCIASTFWKLYECCVSQTCDYVLFKKDDSVCVWQRVVQLWAVIMTLTQDVLPDLPL